jgi:NAD(P)H-dependent FMN reductase
MKILTISGSTRPGSLNSQLLDALTYIVPEHSFSRFDLKHIPIFHPFIDSDILSDNVVMWKKAISEADALIICTPEYLHNIPAVLKNALEWLTSSGELAHKKVLPITYTPHPPRGEKAMQSLIWSLQALDANIITSVALHHSDKIFDNNNKLQGNMGIELLSEAILLMLNQ